MADMCRPQVTYQLIMQHWFLKCAAILSETERIQAMDAIPPALRRANPNMSRDYFLRNRSQVRLCLLHPAL